MYERDFYRQSQFEPVSAVNGGMRVSSYGAAAYSYCPSEAPYREVTIHEYVPASPTGSFGDADRRDDNNPAAEEPAAEPPPYGGSLNLAPTIRRCPRRPATSPVLMEIQRQWLGLDRPQSEPAPVPESEPEPPPQQQREEHKPFHPYLTTTPPPAGREGEEYRYQARAYDGIATGFRWSLTGAPPGMAVDPDSGVLAWTPARGGRYTVTLTAFSLYGKEAVQTWTILVRKAVMVRVHRPNPRYRRALEVRAATLAAKPGLRILAPPVWAWRNPFSRAVEIPAAPPPPPRPPARVTPAHRPSSLCRRAYCLTTEEQTTGGVRAGAAGNVVARRPATDVGRRAAY